MFHLSRQRDGQWHGWHLGPCREREQVSHKLIGSSFVTQSVTACHCYWLAEHIRLWTTSSVLLTRVVHQESKLLIWLRLSARLVNRHKDPIATTDAHHRPVRMHTQRPGRGLQAKQSERLRAQDSAIQKPDQNRNNMSHSSYNHPYVKWTFDNTMKSTSWWCQHLQSVSRNIPPISSRNK